VRAVNSVPISQDKINLGESAPISFPFLIHVEPSKYCNLKCEFCPNRLVDDSEKELMPIEIFEKTITEMKEFPERPRVLKFCGVGEPLVNKKTPDMIKMAKEVGCADRIIMYTNGVLLSPEVNTKIVEGGLDQINISVEGIDDEGYMKFAGTKVAFDNFVANVKDLYQKRKQLKVYVKIHNLAVPTDADKERFYSIFGDISDFISIEGISHIFYNYTSEGEERVVHRYDRSDTSKWQVCAVCFKMLNVNANGSVSACSVDWDRRVVVGNINKESLVEIWNGERIRDLRRRFCMGTIDKSEACYDCSDYYLSGHENLDAYKDDIFARL